MEENKKRSEEEVDRIEKEIETIFGIEGMTFTEEEKLLGKKYLSGEISIDEYLGHFLKK